MTTGNDGPAAPIDPGLESPSQITAPPTASGRGRKNVLDLAAKIVLTQRGIQFFVRNKKRLNRFTGNSKASVGPEYGLQLNRFSPASVQRMILLGYIARVEVGPRNISLEQADLFDLTKLILYTMLYHQFDSRVYDEIFESDLIVRWNRKHLHNPIDRDTPVNEEHLKKLLVEQQEVVSKLQAEITRPLTDSIETNPDLQPDERQVQVFIVEKFVSNLRPFIWFLLAQFRGSEEYFALVTSIRQLMDDYRKRTGIAEYTALVTREVVSNAENINMQDYARLNYGNTWDSGRLLFDKAVRERLASELVSRARTVVVHWTLSSRSGATPGLNNLRIIVQNHQPENLPIPSPDEDRSVYDRRKSLREYYAEIPETVTNTELALYYYSYLAEACRTRGVKFETSVHDSRKTGRTITSLNFQF